MSAQENTVCLVGAGLGNGILAWFLRKRHPHINVVIYEAKPHMTDNRTWSFHESDICEHNRATLDELIVQRWPEYEVRFPRYQRQVKTGYATMTPERLQRALIQAGVEIRFSTSVTEVTSSYIMTTDGHEQSFDCVIDGRGWNATNLQRGYQKFVGLILRLKEPHQLTAPILMDATVPQKDGFRFFYILPFSERTILVEDTRYSVRSDLNSEEFEEEIHKYLEARGWKIEAILKQEKGVLPIPLGQENHQTSALQLGLRGGFFHPVTGYSLPDSVRIADRITSSGNLNRETVRSILSRYRQEQASRKKFYFMLNRMMFLAASDSERRTIFEHFYGLPKSTVERFYAGRTTLLDGLRILSGKPPVAIASALRAIFQQGNKEAL